jgi:hypothetical protein
METRPLNGAYKRLRALLAVLADGDEGLDDLILRAMAVAHLWRGKINGRATWSNDRKLNP